MKPPSTPREARRFLRRWRKAARRARRDDEAAWVRLWAADRPRYAFPCWRQSVARLGWPAVHTYPLGFDLNRAV